MLRGVFILILYFALLFACLFFSFGRLDWGMGWTAIGIYLSISIFTFVRSDPDLVRERSRLEAGVHVRDILIASVSFIFFYPLTMVTAGLDVGRYHWSPILPLGFQWIGLLIFTLGNSLGSWAILANQYFSTFLRIQSDRRHIVIHDGPYAFIRHPGYAGSMLASAALPIALGSLLALLPATIGIIGFIIRTKFEDQTLQSTLPGYRDYAVQVQYRLIPGVW